MYAVLTVLLLVQKEVFQDLSNFGLCSRTRQRFGRCQLTPLILMLPTVV